jgi:purine-nucleoside/S-methyl-5'-thioadenosine phosphorylase / adenosine deaminase
VVVVDGAGARHLGSDPEADALVSASSAMVLSVLTADCAPVALGAPEGAFGAVHAGWRGLLDGVVANAVAAMAELGASSVVAGVGPTIGPCCYEFSPADLDTVATSFGDEVRALSRRGRPALDLPGAVRGALARAGVPVVVDAASCTSCSVGWYSHRARDDSARQALFVWRDDER